MNSEKVFNNIESLDVQEAFKTAILNITAIREARPKYKEEFKKMESILRIHLIDLNK